jgi:hypothetical protein
MRGRRWMAAGFVVAGLALSGAGVASADSIFTVKAYDAPGTPAKYDQVMVRRYGDPNARKVLVLVPGTLAGPGYFEIIAKYLSTHVPNLQVWAAGRREMALQDNSVLIEGLDDQVTPQQVFDYYLGWIGDPSITPHYQPLDVSKYAFAKTWGLNVAMQDLHDVILEAGDHGKRTVILGGHSLGGEEAAIYPAYDFAGHPGYKDIAGIVGIDGGLFGTVGHTALTTQAAQKEVAALDTNPFTDLLGTGLVWSSGAFSEVAAIAALKQPNAPSILQAFPLLPAILKPPIPATNLAAIGYAYDQSTSPPGLALIHTHSGHLDGASPLSGWVDDGPTPAENIVQAFSVEPLGPTEWYYPTKLSIDAQGAGGLTETPVARYLGLHLKWVHQVNVPYYVIQTSLGGANDALKKGAASYKAASKIPSIMVVDRKSTYSHLDPVLATPATNAFLQTVVPWLEKIKLSH